MKAQVTGMAVIGCGYVADFYMATLAGHPELAVAGAFDADPSRLKAFTAHHGIRPYPSLDEALADGRADVVLNLTNPRSHAAVTEACLRAGKHVYSEKPLAMTGPEAVRLAGLARSLGLVLASAPCSVLGEAAQTLGKSIADRAVGRVRLVYATFDDGMVHRSNWRQWRSVSGAPWPAKDEFEVGQVFEHAAYVLSWLAAFFGPARRVQAYARCLFDDKGIAVAGMAPDFSVSCIEYDCGIVARVTCGTVAPPDKSITIIGDDGVLRVTDVRDDAAPIRLRRMPPNRAAAAIAGRLRHLCERAGHALRLPFVVDPPRFERRLPHLQRPRFLTAGAGKPVDFLRGPSELAAAVRQGRPCRLSAELGCHIVEIIEALQHPERFGGCRQIASTFPPF